MFLCFYMTVLITYKDLFFSTEVSLTMKITQQNKKCLYMYILFT